MLPVYYNVRGPPTCINGVILFLPGPTDHVFRSCKHIAKQASNILSSIIITKHMLGKAAVLG